MSILASNCSLARSEQFPPVLMLEYITFDEMRCALYKINMQSWISIVLAHLKTTVRSTCHPTRIYYPDFEQVSLCS